MINFEFNVTLVYTDQENNIKTFGYEFLAKDTETKNACKVSGEVNVKEGHSIQYSEDMTNDEWVNIFASEMGKEQMFSFKEALIEKISNLNWRDTLIKVYDVDYVRNEYNLEDLKVVEV